MSMISLVITLAFIGVLLWAFNKYVTAIDTKIKQLINVVVIICMVVYVLYAFGVLGHGSITDVKVPQLR